MSVKYKETARGGLAVNIIDAEGRKGPDLQVRSTYVTSDAPRARPPGGSSQQTPPFSGAMIDRGRIVLPGAPGPGACPRPDSENTWEK
ncbi:hypothetical protein ACFRH4_13675 [Streptomyces mirabilis]|uniref:hypothetical protein n=1 Tax=Streptomyces mirabilis TaxID=68239 RepID=UPI0036A2B414